MPNHITNILIITGPKTDLEKLRKKIETVNDKKEFCIDFNGTVPMPKEIEDTVCSTRLSPEEVEKQKENKRKYGADNWYGWSCKNWGTKWNAYSACEPIPVENGLQYRFETAWAPPAQWIESTSRLFPSLHFEDYWSDEGGGAGVFKVYFEDDEPQFDEQELSDHDWNMKWNEDYQKQHKLITEGDYKEVIETYSKSDYSDYSDLNRFLLDRITDEDLPLFINFEWYDQQDAFEERLKNAK